MSEKSPEFRPVWLYKGHQPVLCNSAEEFDAAVADGCSDSPGGEPLQASTRDEGFPTMDNTKAEILAFAAELGIELDDSLKKAELLDALAAAIATE